MDSATCGRSIELSRQLQISWRFTSGSLGAALVEHHQSHVECTTRTAGGTLEPWSRAVRSKWSRPPEPCIACNGTRYFQIDGKQDCKIDCKIDCQIDGKTSEIPNLITDMPFHFSADHMHMSLATEQIPPKILGSANGPLSLPPKGERENGLSLPVGAYAGKFRDYSCYGVSRLR